MIPNTSDFYRGSDKRSARRGVLLSVGLLVMMFALTGPKTVQAQNTAFSYQGRLMDHGVPASGTYDLRFTLYGTTSGGMPVDAPVESSGVVVEQGLFVAELDFGSAAFDGSDRWLEIAVRPDGGTGYTSLSPRQSIHRTPYAIHAQTSDAMPVGSITGEMLAPGAVTSSQLANNSVGVEQLVRPYLAGQIAYDSLLGTVANFGTMISERTVTFSPPFSSIPLVTHSIDTAHPALMEKGPVLVSSRSAAQVTFRIPWAPVGVEVMRRAGGLQPSIEVVDGHPAVLANGQINLSLGLTYCRAADASGENWGDPIILQAGYATSAELFVADGRPAVAFLQGGAVYFVRADDVNGEDWPVPTQVYDPVKFGAMSRLSAAVIANHPALVFANGSIVVHTRATDAAGGAWENPVSLATVPSTPSVDLAEIGGRPAVAMLSEQSVKYARADDSVGGSWPGFIDAVPDPNPSSPWDAPFSDCELLDIGGTPGIGYVRSEGLSNAGLRLMFVMADNPVGSDWNVAQSVTAAEPGPLEGSFAVLNGVPKVAFVRENRLHFVNAFGSPPFFNFLSPTEMEPAVGRARLTEVGGRAVVAFEAESAIRFVRDGTPPPNSSVSWIAVAP